MKVTREKGSAGKKERTEDDGTKNIIGDAAIVILGILRIMESTRVTKGKNKVTGSTCSLFIQILTSETEQGYAMAAMSVFPCCGVEPRVAAKVMVPR